MRSHFWPLIILTILALIGSKALFHFGWYTSHDGEHQLVRQYIFDKAIKAGHIPPRIDRQLFNGLGYPLMTFTYQLPFIIGEPFRLLGLSVQDTVKVVFILTYLASGLTMYLFAQELWGKNAGLLAGFLYLWAPYRFLTLFVRASLGEHVALVFIPLLLWAFNRHPLKPVRIIIGALSLAAIILSHMMVAQMALPLIALFWLANFLEGKQHFQKLAHLTMTGLLAAGLTAYYLLPALNLRSAIQGLNRHFYAEHFVTLKQLFYSPWGYAFSQVGTANDGMSFQVGLAQWLVVGLVVVFVFKRGRLARQSVSLSLLAAFAAAIFMMLDSSSWLWNSLVKRYFVVDIPWRFLAITTITSAALAGWLFSQLKSSFFKTSLVVLIIFLALYSNRNHLRVNKYIDYPDIALQVHRGTSTSYDEYQSVYTSQALLKRQNLPEAEIISGAANITINRSAPHQLLLTINVTSDAVIQLNTIYFPGWTININDQLQDIKSILNDGVPRLSLLPGNYRINLLYRPTPIMRAGNVISLVTIAVLLFLWLTRSRLSW